MASSEKCIPPTEPTEPDPLDPDSIDFSPDVCVFRHVALLHVPEPCRGPLRHLGNLLFDWSMETFGIANEEPDTEGGMRPVDVRPSRVDLGGPLAVRSQAC